MARVSIGRIQLVVAMAATLTLLSGCGGAQARFGSHFERGKQYLQQGNIDKADIEFRNALQIRSKDPDALYYGGLVAERKGNVRNAAGYYQAAIDSRADFADARARLGRLYVFGAVTPKALEVIAPGLAQHPENPDLLAVRAAAEQQRKNLPAALTDAEHAIKVAPGNENAAAVLAALYADNHDYARATTVLRNALSINPKSVDLHEVLTNIYLLDRNAEQAEAQMRTIIGLQPDELPPRTQLAGFLQRQRKLDAAQQVLEEAVRVFDRHEATQNAQNASRAKLALVNFIVAERSREQGEKLLRGFMARDPDNYELRFGLGALLLRAKDLPAATAVYQEVIAKDRLGPQGLAARDRIAAIQVSQGQDAQARKLIAEVLQKNPRDDDALILRAHIAMNAHDPTSAVADLRVVLRDQPRSLPLQQLIARAYLEKNEPALAEEALRAAMDIAPDDVATRTQLAQVLVQRGHPEQSVTLLQDGVKRSPKSIPLRLALTRLYLSQKNGAAAHDAAADLTSAEPQSPLGPYFAGLASFEMGKLDDSRKEFEQALALAPADADAMQALANLELAAHKPDRALARVQAAVARNPKDPRNLNLLGELQMRSKDYERAGTAFAQASELAPKWWLPYRNQALAREAAGDTAGAVERFAAGLKAAPLEAALVIEAGAFLEQHGQVDAAIAAYDALYAGNRDTRQLAANNLAMLLANHKTDAASLDRARDLSAPFSSSTNSNFLDTSGWVRFKRGEFRDALPVLERASATAPDSRVIRYHLAMTELRLGMKDRARSDLRSALQGTSEFSGSAEARSVLASLGASTG
jgi:tetratricopeptide (TPR) repeat protein